MPLAALNVSSPLPACMLPAVRLMAPVPSAGSAAWAPVGVKPSCAVDASARIVIVPALSVMTLPLRVMSSPASSEMFPSLAPTWPVTRLNVPPSPMTISRPAASVTLASAPPPPMDVLTSQFACILMSRFACKLT